MSDEENSKQNSLKEFLPGIVAFVAGMCMVFFLRKPDCNWIHYSWLQYLAVPFLVSAVIFLWKLRRVQKDGLKLSVDRSTLIAFGLLASLLVFLVSSATKDLWFFFLRWDPSAGTENIPLLKSGLVRFCVFSAVLMPVLLFCRSKVSIWVITIGVLLWSQITCFNQLWNVTGGQALYSDDHPSLMYRLWVYARTFPGLIYYDSLWNGGREASYLISTGVIPLGTIFLPLWKLFSIDQVYTPALAMAFIVIVPLLAGFSVRVIGGSWISACCASILALGVSQYFFLWMLHFGTVGSCFALPFVMLVCAGLYRVLWLDRLDNWTGTLLVIASAVFLAWPPAVVMAVFMLPAIVAGIRKWSFRKMAFLIVCGFILVVILVPSVVGIMGHADPMGFIQPAAKKVELSCRLEHGWKTLCAHLRQGNPCLVFFGILGLWFIPQKGMKTLYGVSIMGLMLLAGWGDEWKPLLQLSRTGIPLMFVVVTPAAILMGRWLENASLRMVPVRAMLVTLLLLSGLNSARFYGNRGPGIYVTMNSEIKEIVEWLKSNVSERERILFAGMTVHGYGRGHVAYLPVLTGREMMACDYYHFSPKKVEYDYPPRDFRLSDRRVMDFMNLYNVGFILTYHDSWKKFFRKYPGEYEEIKSFGEKKKRTVFKVKRTANQFLKGTGSVKADINELHVKVDNPFEEAVLRYNWVEGLSADAPVEVKPIEVDKNIRFIVVNPHGKTNFRILYRKWL